jgi:hypothetical protein
MNLNCSLIGTEKEYKKILMLINNYDLFLTLLHKKAFIAIGNRITKKTIDINKIKIRDIYTITNKRKRIKMLILINDIVNKKILEINHIHDYKTCDTCNKIIIEKNIKMKNLHIYLKETYSSNELIELICSAYLNLKYEYLFKKKFKKLGIGKINKKYNFWFLTAITCKKQMIHYPNKLCEDFICYHKYYDPITDHHINIFCSLLENQLYNNTSKIRLSLQSEEKEIDVNIISNILNLMSSSFNIKLKNNFLERLPYCKIIILHNTFIIQNNILKNNKKIIDKQKLFSTNDIKYKPYDLFNTQFLVNINNLNHNIPPIESFYS